MSYAYRFKDKSPYCGPIVLTRSQNSEQIAFGYLHWTDTNGDLVYVDFVKNEPINKLDYPSLELISEVSNPIFVLPFYPATIKRA